MAQADSNSNGHNQAPEPPAYDYQKNTQNDARTVGALGPVHPEDGSPWARVDRKEVVKRVFSDEFNPKAFADADNPEEFPRAVEYHSEWLTRDAAAELVESFPEVPASDFWPRRVANAIRALPESVRISVGREKVPVVYIWTGRPALTAILRDAATWNLQLGVVKSFPAASAGEEPCRFGGQPGGKWQVVRAGWARGTCPVGGEESEMWSEGGE